MSLSREGAVFFGYCWQREHGIDADDVYVSVYDLARSAVEKSGWERNPDDPMENWRREQEARAAIGVEFGFHGNGTEALLYLGAMESITAAPAGDGVPLDPAVFSRDTGPWREKLDRFVAAHAVTLPEGENQPGWWVACRADDYG